MLDWQFIISGYFVYVYFEPIPVCRKSDQVNGEHKSEWNILNPYDKNFESFEIAVRTEEGHDFSSDVTKQGSHL